MAKEKKTSTEVSKKRRATSPEARENQLISYAYDLVEQRLLNGTATSQETTHFLKLGSSRERIEKEIREKELKLIEAKTEQIEASKRDDEFYAKVIEHMKRYAGSIND